MSANFDVHHIEARQGFADQGGGQDSGRSPGRGLPWQALLDALAAGDVELARRHYHQAIRLGAAPDPALAARFDD